MVKDPLIGRLVDSRYEIVDRVARGGMATVYRAHDRRLDRDVGLKLMHAHLADSPDFVSRFRREARSVAKLSNSGVVAVYDQGSLDGIAYLVMEYVEGPNLRDLIAAGPLSVREALGLTAQILRPLGAAHRAGLIHRDIKPENVLLPADGSVAKVTDFGLARAVTEATQTTTGNVLGTVAYLAPELITSGSSSPRADVFSVGVIVYELLTGEQPFVADSPIQIAFRNVHEDLPRPSELVPDLPENVDELVATMTRRDPEQRPQDADEALSLLRRTVSGLTDSELAVRRGGGTASVRKQEVLAANAEAARMALDADAPETSDDEEDLDTTPGAGLRTVSLPIGSIGPDARGAADGTTRHLARDELARSDGQDTTAVPRGSRSRIGRRSVLGAVAVAVAGSASAGAWYRLKGPGRVIAVPDVIGLSSQDARRSVERAGLSWAEPTHEYSDTVPENSVISCDPAPGTGVHVNRTVSVVVSRGVERKTVPDVVGGSLEQAKKKIVDAGLAVGAVTQEYSDSVATGMVISTNPEAGRSVNRSSAVAIVVSKGPEMVTVPDVAGKKKDKAKAALEDAGLTVTVSEVLGGLLNKARSTDPPAGTSVKKGSSVTLFIM